MPCTELEALVADPRLAAAGLREVAERGARAMAAAVACDGCEVWIWRSSAEGDRTLERVASFGPQLARSPLESVASDLALVGAPIAVRTDDGHAVSCTALGVHGAAVLVRRDSAAVPETAHLGPLAARFGATQVVAGSDYPFTLGDPDPVNTLSGMQVDAVTLQAFCRDNALRFLGR